MYTDEPAGGAAPPDAGEASDSPSAVISKEAFGGHECKPGDTYTVKVLAVHDDDVEVQVVGTGTEEEAPPEAPPMGGEGMAPMME